MALSDARLAPNAGANSPADQTPEPRPQRAPARPQADARSALKAVAVAKCVRDIGLSDDRGVHDPQPRVAHEHAHRGHYGPARASTARPSPTPRRRSRRPRRNAASQAAVAASPTLSAMRSVGPGLG